MARAHRSVQLRGAGRPAGRHAGGVPGRASGARLVHAVGVAASAGRRHQEVALRGVPLLGERARHQGHPGGHAGVRQGAHRRRNRLINARRIQPWRQQLNV